MRFADAVAALERRQEARIELGLGRVRRHLAALGNPQESFRSIHVAGTNGKGSVCAMLASMFQAAGWRVGLYTSPHLSDVRERIKVGGRKIPRRAFGRAMERALGAKEGARLTYFELATSVAFQYFREAGVDIGVLETGLGGRLDATNVVRKPLAAAIPSVDYDHMAFLGGTLAGIAREKAGIFKRGAPAIVAETKPGPLRVLRREARRRGARWFSIGRTLPWRVSRVDWLKGEQVLEGPGRRRLALHVLGASQARNAALALKVVEAAREQGFDVPEKAVAAGTERLRWPGRFEVLRRGGRVLILDGAHNVQAMRNFGATLRRSPWHGSPKLFILGMLRDKQHEEMIRVLRPFLAEAVAVRPPSPRALDPVDLAAEVRRVAPAARVSAVERPGGALAAWSRARGGPRVACVCGSFYLVGLARKLALRRGFHAP